MPTINEYTNTVKPKPPLGAQLAEGVRVLSSDQRIHFDLYQKYVFPLDGMVYWVKTAKSPDPLSNPNVRNGETIQLEPGRQFNTIFLGQNVLAIGGNLDAEFILGGQIINPFTAEDQGISISESIYVSITGPADTYANDDTVEIRPGEIFHVPANPVNGVWVNATTAGHKFTCVVFKVGTEFNNIPISIDVKGSLHYSVSAEQEEDSSVDVNQLLFTSLSEVQEFNNIGSDQLYIATYRNIRFAFAGRSFLYEQADLYHYIGEAIYSTSETQIIDDILNFKPYLAISNSLPIWISLNGYVPTYQGFVCPFRLYPSYLVDDNIKPPFGAVHIEKTKSLVASPLFGRKMEQFQLCRDNVKITTYGVNNEMIQTFLAFILEYSKIWNIIGMANMPVISDLKEPHPELRIINQKKVIEFEINYFQDQTRDIIRKLITSAKCHFYVNGTLLEAN